jgi:hypothetical protein
MISNCNNFTFFASNYTTFASFSKKSSAPLTIDFYFYLGLFVIALCCKLPPTCLIIRHCNISTIRIALFPIELCTLSSTTENAFCWFAQQATSLTLHHLCHLSLMINAFFSLFMFFFLLCTNFIITSCFIYIYNFNLELIMKHWKNQLFILMRQ